MAITRTPIIDDDGSGETGTIINNAWKQEFYNQIDTALIDTSSTLIVTTATGTQNNFNPAPGIRGTLTVIECRNASKLTITGFIPGIVGQRIRVIAITAEVAFTHLDSASAAARIANIATSAPTPIAAGGSAEFVLNSFNVWVLVSHEQGAWITPPFNAADYGAVGSMAWSVIAGNVIQAKYRLSGRTLQWALQITGSSLTGTASAAFFRSIMGGYAASGGGAHMATVHYQNVATLSSGPITVYTATTLQFLRDASGGTPWQIGGINVLASGTLEVS